MSVVAIDRTVPFGQAKPLGSGLKIIEQDEKALTLTEVNLSQVILVNAIAGREQSIGGHEQIRRLMHSRLILLDAQIMQVLWEDQTLIPPSWDIKKGGMPFICFDGTVLRDSHGNDYTLCLCRQSPQPGKEWTQVLYNLKHTRHPNKLSAVLTP
ncbi:MAG: hypothetical protein HYT21_00065 [Candidatus Nealsonbacteria bacterium]|nr:hypothetical protein [Candidatus Nealsonbacteria bacterium]